MSVAADFAISAKELSEIVSLHTEQPDVIKKYGGRKGIVEKVRSNTKTGLKGETHDLESRVKFFGKNYVEDKPIPSFFEICFNSLQDFTLIMLMCSAFLNIVLGMTLEV